MNQNRVSQLLVPASTFTDVRQTGSGLEVCNEFGCWPAAPTDRPLGNDLVWARLRPGSDKGPIGRGVTWDRGGTDQWAPTAVLESYEGTFDFAEESPDRPGLRAPQLGAVHAVLAYWTTGRRVPATVVMPTGTGKTETMLALLVAARPDRLLVLVPSDALRE